jgi:hypothetical protein
MNLRKAGFFKGLPRSRRSNLTPEEIDRYSYGCEIAMQLLKRDRRTLDRVLCEPAEAAEFDRDVRAMISEKVSSFKIRWVALYIRKRASGILEAGRDLTTIQPLPQREESIPSLDRDAVPESRGLYWLQSPEQPLYVGKTFDLRQRFYLQFHKPKFDFWGTERQNVRVRYCPLPDANDTFLKQNQSGWIVHWNPVGNFTGFDDK